MAISTNAKQFSIKMGLYRPARWFSRLVRADRQRNFRANIDLYRALLPSNALCFDVGANIGEKSEALLKTGARVVAFEPNPLVIPELRARCSHHRNWTVVEAALGSGAAVATLYARESSGQSSLGADWEGKTIANYPVPVVTLDSAIECFGHPDYCKIDVEGWELEVLRGLTYPIPLISFEFHLNTQNIQKTVSCLERLAQFGPSRVNITAGEKSIFHLQEWIPTEQFLSWFPSGLERVMSYGDIFVKYDAA